MYYEIQQTPFEGVSSVVAYICYIIGLPFQAFTSTYTFQLYRH